MRNLTEKQMKKAEDKILSMYENAYQEIYKTLVINLDYSKNPSFSNMSMFSLMKQIEFILDGLNSEIAKEIPSIYVDLVEYGYLQSVVAYLTGQGLGGTDLEEAIRDFPFSTVGKTVAEQLAKDTMKDLLEVTNNTHNSVKILIRETFQKHLATQMLLQRDFKFAAQELLKHIVGSGLRLEVKDGIVAIVDSIGRKWKLDTYLDMAIRTKFHQAKIEAMQEFTKENGGLCDLAIIPKNGALDECRLFEGLVISLTGLTEGYRSYDQLKATNKIFHPRCKHYPAPIRTIENLPLEDIEFHDMLNSEMLEYLTNIKK